VEGVAVAAELLSRKNRLQFLSTLITIFINCSQSIA
jgi:hypothetical protein